MFIARDRHKFLGTPSRSWMPTYRHRQKFPHSLGVRCFSIPAVIIEASSSHRRIFVRRGFLDS